MNFNITTRLRGLWPLCDVRKDDIRIFGSLMFNLSNVLCMWARQRETGNGNGIVFAFYSIFSFSIWLKSIHNFNQHGSNLLVPGKLLFTCWKIRIIDTWHQALLFVELISLFLSIQFLCFSLNCKLNCFGLF